MNKTEILSLFLISLVCVTGCSEDPALNMESSQESTVLTEQSAEDVSSESAEEVTESSEGADISSEEADDTSPAETVDDAAVAAEEDIFGLNGSRTYNTRVEAFSDCVYSAEEWLSEDGHLSLPFDENAETEYDDNLDYKFGRYYIPEEALEAASTEDLLSICTDTFFATAVIAFESLDYQVQYLTDNLNAVDAVFARDDFAKALLQAYQEDTLERQETYSEDADGATFAVITEELFLARNEVFDQMTDEMREETLSEVVRKLELIESGEYYYADFGGSCFFYYVGDLCSDGDGRWYEYLQEYHPEYLEYCEHSPNYM